MVPFVSLVADAELRQRHAVEFSHCVWRVVEAITKIKEVFKEPLNVKDLARSVSMSESSLYHNFKQITAMSPLQFQKSLRLQEAGAYLRLKRSSQSDTRR